MAKSRKQKYSIQTINKYLREVDKGALSKTQVKRIMTVLESRRKLANSRLRRLSDAGLLRNGFVGSVSGKTALQYARSISGVYNAMSFFKPKDIVTALEQGLYIERFLESKSSFVKGAKTGYEIKKHNFVNKFDALKDYSDKELDEFMTFIDDSTVHDFFSFFANYKEAMEMLGVIFQEENGKKFLNEVFDEMRKYKKMQETMDYMDIKEGLNAREARDRIKARYNSIIERRRR